MANTIASTYTVQMVVNYARAAAPWTNSILSVPGFTDEPAVSFADDIVKKIMAKANPWKWNMIKAPSFYTQPYQQDYPTSISMNAMGWLQNCTMVDINNADQQPPVQPPITCVLDLLPTSSCGNPTKICWLANSLIVTGLWPGPQVTYQNPLFLYGGGPGNNPLTAIKDANGNIQVVTGYGITGTFQPTWPAANAPAGTVTQDGTVVWTVQDPNGVAFRLDRLATFGSQVWQMNPTYQQKPPTITSLGDTFAPVPDDLNYLIRQGFLAYCYSQIDSAKFQEQYKIWEENIAIAMGASDREDQEFGFYPAQPIQGGGGTGQYGYPGWLGWSSDSQ
jgi:hypothetical protein